jgi:hypothetical protein
VPARPCGRLIRRYWASAVRTNAAADLAKAGRLDDALLHARAALRGYEALGPAAASDADQVRQLIAAIEQAQQTPRG